MRAWFLHVRVLRKEGTLHLRRSLMSIPLRGHLAWAASAVITAVGGPSGEPAPPEAAARSSVVVIPAPVGEARLGGDEMTVRPRFWTRKKGTPTYVMWAVRSGIGAAPSSSLAGRPGDIRVVPREGHLDPLGAGRQDIDSRRVTVSASGPA